jgi:cathepsin B
MGARAYYIGANPLDIQTELLQHGPVEASFTVYADFLTYGLATASAACLYLTPPPAPLSYKSGVYKHVAGELLGGHSVRLLGWGTDAGQDYWIIANSWNEVLPRASCL